MQPLFIATRKFDPSCGKKWDDYVIWTGLSHLNEVVSLDILLCPTVLPEILDIYWEHITNKNLMLNYFRNLDFLLNQIEGMSNKNILCVYRNPELNFSFATSHTEFNLLGFDLIELGTGISAISNCGGYPDVFENSELSRQCLVTDHLRAIEIQSTLRALHPADSHANCDIWAIFRMESP